MSASVSVVAVKAPDDMWRKHKAVYDACKAADIDPPEETDRYFEDGEPNPIGVIVRLGYVGHSATDHPSADSFIDDHATGIRVDISKLPVGTTHIEVEWGG